MGDIRKIFCLLLVLISEIMSDTHSQTYKLNAETPQTFEDTVSSASGEKLYTIQATLNDIQTVRIHSEVSGHLSPSHPVEWTVRQPGGRVAWDIPNKLSQNSNTADKTLCPFVGTDNITIVVTTSSSQEQEFSLTVSVVDFVIKTGIPLTRDVSPTSPQVFRFHLPPEKDDHLLLKVTGKNNPVCAVVSIQKADWCPFYDDESNYKFGAIYQTMLNLSAISLNLDRERFKDAVNIILLVKNDDKACYHRDELLEIGDLNRTVSMTIEVIKLDESTWLATLVTLGLYIGGGVLASFFTFCQLDFDSKFKQFDESLEREVRRKKSATAFGGFLNAIRLPVNFSSRGKTSSSDQVDAVERNNGSLEMNRKVEGTNNPIQATGEQSAENSLQSDAPLTDGSHPEEDSEETPFLMCWQDEDRKPSFDEPDSAVGSSGLRKMASPILEDLVRSRHSSGTNPAVKKVIEIDKTKVKEWRAHPHVNVAVMSVEYDRRRFPNSMRMRSEMFGWLLVIVGIYYTLPVFQLVYNYQETTKETGDKDTCYYNYLCLYPMGVFEDHGHIFSNIGYIISGIFFMLVVLYRSIKFNRLCKKWDEKLKDQLGGSHKKNPRRCGIPEQYGIYYAMGGALTMEGVLSGCYHICPTRENFQFDTTFMYLISVLVFLKVYQFRHADITKNAYLVFLYVGLALVFEVIGYYTDHIIFWIIFAFVYIASIIVFVIQVYYNGTGVRDKLKKFGEQLKKCENFGPKSWTNLMLPSIIVIFINIIIAFFFLYKNKAGVSRYILIILMLNMIMYVCSYIAKKLFWRFRASDWRVGESLRKTTMIYGMASLAFMFAAVIFFKKELKTGSGTPAQSRNLNDVCAVSIFDNHDLWHFLSAAGLFMGFMFILTIEDHNMAVPRNKIPVF